MTYRLCCFLLLATNVLAAPNEIETDLLVLATGIVPELPEQLTAAFGSARDIDGFFAEAESKWYGG